MNSDCPGFGDAGYYRGVLANRGLFTSDQTLLANAATANQVIKNARNPQAWRLKFPAAMLKMGQLDVLTGNAGEIRTNCRVINSKREREECFILILLLKLKAGCLLCLSMYL